MPGWLKAGLIGAVVLVVLTLLGLIPIVSCLVIPLTLLAYAGIGALAASYMPPPRAAGQAAGQGALAATVASVIGGIAQWILTAVQASTVNIAEAISQLPPETLQQLEDAGVDPALFFGGGMAAVVGFICCSVGVLVAVALGAVGGAIYAAARQS